MPNEPHDEFLELSALSTSGHLSEEEQERLREHLAICPACREAAREYESVVQDVIPAIAVTEETESFDPGPGWSQKKAEKEFFRRLEAEEKRKSQDIKEVHSTSPLFAPSRRLHGPTWPQVWLVYAAGILFFISAGLYVYRLHLHGGPGTRREVPQTNSIDQSKSTIPLEQELSDIGHERAVAEAAIHERDKVIADFRRQLAVESANIEQMKVAQQHLQDEIRSSQTGREELAQEQQKLSVALQASQNSSRGLAEKIDGLREQSDRESAYAKSLEAKNQDLTRLLEQRARELEQQDQLLAHDKDIRDLMGARDLYVAEVYDIARTGETKKPYGRVFYTRGKSLIFYAYDLDQDGDAKKASTFQAWGRRGTDRQTALNLGIFFEDNIARKRWILKCEDPKTLAEIDGVFVTVEPSGGSEKPSGKPLLSAYLKINPNHP